MQSQPSRRFTIWERLSSRFLIEPVPAEATPAPGVGTEIQPITDVDELLRVPTAAVVINQDISAAVAFSSMFTVPEGKRWHVKSVWRESTTGLSQIAFRVVTDAGTIISRVTISQTGEDVWIGNVILNESAQIGVFTTNNGADTSKDIDTFYEEEDAF